MKDIISERTLMRTMINVIQEKGSGKRERRAVGNVLRK